MKEIEELAEWSLSVFIAENCDSWATLRQSLEPDSRTTESLWRTDESLFAICLDDVEFKDEFPAAMEFLHYTPNL